ncbi:hypothetical protein HZS61_002200 [Fusarium oxysporum f. sp. conglutinans]|uniref:Transcription factor domain-containing protein n=1 Tax=Fusarium oxysporum f. sp. conglutinans TaxID=100902 RepID=A0A8H6GI22_FUSOX|nr:hypothetical protein HZS61_002200 [Fusarium oxysporum f. sp. conglutinans]KAG7001053.1 hypothetical protein FocnCong_v012389 [Fusarium oxysporum f. sp. conglutinans]
MEVLPSLLGNTANNNLLAPAIKALGVSIVARGHNGRAPIPDALQAQCVALHTLQGNICHTKDSSFNALAASMMCLFLSEILLPTSPTGSTIHAEGVATLLQRYPPSFYSSGTPHKLFAGFRPILVLHSFLTRRSSFLATDSWKTEPFAHVSATPLQALMNDVIAVPAIFEELDTCKFMPASRAAYHAENALTMIVAVVDRLTQSYHSTLLSGNSWWYMSRAENEVSLWFPDITVANYLTHYWAFWIICVTHIRQLREAYPSLKEREVLVDGQAPESQDISEKLMDLSTQIFQSIEFLIQDEMKLFGIASAALPFQTACSFLKRNNGSEGVCSGMYKQVLDKIVQRGYGNMLINGALSFGYPQPAV